MIGFMFDLETIIAHLERLAADPVVGGKAEFVSVGLPSLREGQRNALDCSGVILPMVFDRGHGNNVLEVRLVQQPRGLRFLLPEDMPLFNVVFECHIVLGVEEAILNGLSCWRCMNKKAESQGMRTFQDGALSGTVTRVMDAIFLEFEHSRWVLIKSG